MTAAIGIVFSFMSFIQALGFWFGYGSGNIMSKIGEQNDKEAKKFAYRLSPVSTGLIIAFLSLIFIIPLSKFLGGTPQMICLNLL